MVELSTRLKLKQWYLDPVRFFREVYRLEPYPYQAQVMKEIRNLSMRRIMTMAAGATGKTILWSAVGLWSSTVLSHHLGRPYDTLIISGSGEQSRKLYDYSKVALSTNKVLSSLVVGEPLKSLTTFSNGSHISALPNSQKAIQGQHGCCVIVDEAAIAGDFVIRDTQRIVGPYSNEGLDRRCFSGTPYDAFSLFVEMFEDRTKYPDWDPEKPDYPDSWRRYRWSASECPGISKSAFEEARRGSQEVFTVFWLGEKYEVTDTVVPLRDIKRVSDGVPKPDWDPSLPTYFGIDWGFTSSTVLIITQDFEENGIKKHRVVDVLVWNRKEYEDVHTWINTLGAQYKPLKTYVDLNPKGESERSKNGPLRSIPVAMNNERAFLTGNMSFLIKEDRLEIPEEFVELLIELKKLKWDQREGDDRAVALMLSLKRDPEPTGKITRYVFSRRSRGTPLDYDPHNFPLGAGLKSIPQGFLSILR